MKVLDTVSGLTAKDSAREAGTVVFTDRCHFNGRIWQTEWSFTGITDKFQLSLRLEPEVLSATQYTSSPALGPRAVSVNRDGTSWISGWTLNDPDVYIISQFPNVTGALNIGSVQIDPNRDVIYAQMGKTRIEDASSSDPRRVQSNGP